MTTVTLPREVVQQALDAIAPVSKYGKVGSRDIEQAALQAALSALRAALDAPAKPVDCRGCANHTYRVAGDNHNSYCYKPCTDFDKFQALPPIVLTKVTK